MDIPAPRRPAPQPLIVQKECRGSKEECERIATWLGAFGYRRGVMSWKLEADSAGDGWTIKALVVG